MSRIACSCVKKPDVLLYKTGEGSVEWIMEKIKAVVLAAGMGTRLQTEGDDAPKVMRTVCDKPLLWYVLNALSFIEKKDIIIVVGYKKNDVIEYFGGYTFSEQTKQNGTGDAVKAAAPELQGFCGAVLVCYGDMPAVRRETYETLIHAHFEQDNDCTILTGEAATALPYGRIIRDQNGGFLQVVEDRDCTPAQKKIKELNSGVYVFRTPMLLKALGKMKCENSQGEYYLTDVPAIMRDSGAKVGIVKRDLGDEILGVNTPEQLAQIGEIIQMRNK